jgi:hypothetical protein
LNWYLAIACAHPVVINALLDADPFPIFIRTLNCTWSSSKFSTLTCIGLARYLSRYWVVNSLVKSYEEYRRRLSAKFHIANMCKQTEIDKNILSYHLAFLLNDKWMCHLKEIDLKYIIFFQTSTKTHQECHLGLS